MSGAQEARGDTRTDVINIQSLPHIPEERFRHVAAGLVSASGIDSKHPPWNAFSADESGCKWAITWKTNVVPWIRCRWLNDCKVVGLYTVRSANNHPERDPSDWVLQGCLEMKGSGGGSCDAEWWSLDVQRGVVFSERNQQLRFWIPKGRRAPFQAYRLCILRLRDPSKGVKLHIGAFGLFESSAMPRNMVPLHGTLSGE